mgnify:CR=1 FL=1
MHLHGSTLAVVFSVSCSKQTQPAWRRIWWRHVRSSATTIWRDTRMRSRRTEISVPRPWAAAVDVVVKADDSLLAPRVRERLHDQVYAPRRAVLPTHVSARYTA